MTYQVQTHSCELRDLDNRLRFSPPPEVTKPGSVLPPEDPQHVGLAHPPSGVDVMIGIQLSA